MTVSLGNGVDIGNLVTAETNPVTGENVFIIGGKSYKPWPSFRAWTDFILTLTPTIYFDPTASTSANTGALYVPYSPSNNKVDVSFVSVPHLIPRTVPDLLPVITDAIVATELYGLSIVPVFALVDAVGSK